MKNIYLFTALLILGSCGQKKNFYQQKYTNLGKMSKVHDEQNLEVQKNSTTSYFEKESEIVNDQDLKSENELYLINDLEVESILHPENLERNTLKKENLELKKQDIKDKKDKVETEKGRKIMMISSISLIGAGAILIAVSAASWSGGIVIGAAIIGAGLITLAIALLIWPFKDKNRVDPAASRVIKSWSAVLLIVSLLPIVFGAILAAFGFF